MDGKQMTSEMEQLKTRLQATWASGDFGRIAAAYAPGAAEFVDRLAVKPGNVVLDVACGTGNLAIPAAKRGADVIGLDIVPDLIEQARANAATEGVAAEFEIGDAESMPYEDGAFDVVMSMFGAMFTPRPIVVAAELKRVCKPGGFIAMANWTPAGFIGHMFRTTGKHVPPPASMPSPLLWGDEETVRERFGTGVADLRMEPREIDFVLPFGPVETVEHFRNFYGPIRKAFEFLDADAQSALRRDLEELWAANNRAQDGSTRVVSEYLEVRVVPE